MTLEIQAGGDGFEASVDEVRQRNWSRVGRASSPRGHLFVKQFVDRRGTVRADHLAHEVSGMGVVAELDCVRSTRLLGSDPGVVVLAFEWEEFAPIDGLLRSLGDDDFDPVWRRSLVPCLRPLLDELTGLVGTEIDVPGAPAAAGPGRTSVGLKGLDVRNLGLERLPSAHRPLVFDPGKPYFGPVEHVGAKLLISVGLLNWGWPMARFRRGVPERVLDQAAAVIGDLTSRDALLAEVATQRRSRFGAVPSRRGPIGMGQRIAMQHTGSRYLADLEEWCARRF